MKSREVLISYELIRWGCSNGGCHKICLLGHVAVLVRPVGRLTAACGAFCSLYNQIMLQLDSSGQ